MILDGGIEDGIIDERERVKYEVGGETYCVCCVIDRSCLRSLCVGVELLKLYDE